eukprot:m.144809 g.144809  ORF g.144809 m.144809 type:complete len:50 (-) comp14135_c1_seq5:53-202(-)
MAHSCWQVLVFSSVLVLKRVQTYSSRASPGSQMPGMAELNHLMNSVLSS